MPVDKPCKPQSCGFGSGGAWLAEAAPARIFVSNWAERGGWLRTQEAVGGRGEGGAEVPREPRPLVAAHGLVVVAEQRRYPREVARPKGSFGGALGQRLLH